MESEHKGPSGREDVAVAVAVDADMDVAASVDMVVCVDVSVDVDVAVDVAVTVAAVCSTGCVLQKRDVLWCGCDIHTSTHAHVRVCVCLSVSHQQRCVVCIRCDTHPHAPAACTVRCRNHAHAHTHKCIHISDRQPRRPTDALCMHGKHVRALGAARVRSNERHMAAHSIHATRTCTSVHCDAIERVAASLCRTHGHETCNHDPSIYAHLFCVCKTKL